MTARRRRDWALAVAGLTLGLASCWPPAETPRPADPPAAGCLEDEPCWDCATMGNLVCGARP